MYRIERDSMGEMQVDDARMWGAQTQRSLENFHAGDELMPREVICAFARLKRAAAAANCEMGALSAGKRDAISDAAGEILDGKLWDEFPLHVWQTGSGTQSNMNVNEVIANRGNSIRGEKLLHPNDDVNRSQSSNDTFPTAMHLAAVEALTRRVIPAARSLAAAFSQIERKYPDAITVGRTHLQDAVPIRFSQEVSGWRAMVEKDVAALEAAFPPLLELPLGGTAVGTGLNAPKGFDALSAAYLARDTGLPFVTSDNKFQSLTSLSPFVAAHGAMKALAADLIKIANDVRFLSSGPRCGLGEIRIPENEPGSSIMPGKVNPTQCEAVIMIAIRVMGNDTSIGIAAGMGNFQLNVCLPVAIHAFLQSARLLAGGMDSFREKCVCGISPIQEKMRDNLARSLMNVTALNPLIGYDNAAKVAKCAFREDISLPEAAEKLGLLTREEAERAIDPAKMT